MTPTQLQTRLARLYGKDLSTQKLCISITRDMGLTSLDTARKWINGVNPVPPYMGLVLDALEARKAAGH